MELPSMSFNGKLQKSMYIGSCRLLCGYENEYSNVGHHNYHIENHEECKN